MLQLEAIQSEISSDKKRSAGASCTYYQIGDIGIKTWWSLSEAESCYEKQRELGLAGYAPKVIGEIFQAENARGYTIHGYQTEVVAVFGQTINKQEDKPWDSEIYNCIRDNILARNKEMAENMEMMDHDDHWHNWGVCPSGVIKCLDMDHVGHPSDY